MYLSDKRGKSNIKNEFFLKEVKNSAEKIIQDNDVDLVKETCRLCRILKSKGLFPFTNSRINNR
jgi:hypothetical protein